MCIAVVKPCGVAMPSEDILKNCFYSNPDGAGIMLVRDKQVLIRKGYMTFADFMAALTALEVGEHELCGLHFRITTAGGTSKANCHPFPLSQVAGDLKNICLETDAAMMHNGIFGPGRQDLSDTMLFVMDHAADPFIRRKIFTDKGCHEYLRRLTHGSRVCFFSAKHGYKLLGDWRKDAGVYYSNTSYLYSSFDWPFEDEESPACPTCGALPGCGELIDGMDGCHDDFWLCSECSQGFDNDGKVYDAWINCYGDEKE